MREDGLEGLSFGTGPEQSVPDWSSPFGSDFIEADAVHVGLLEFGGASGRFWWQGEATRIEVDRPGRGSDAIDGAYAQVAYMFSGPTREWDGSSGAWGGLHLEDARFDPGAGEWGAIEIGARYSVFDVSSFEGGRQQVGTLG